MQSWVRILGLVVKELRTIWHDKRSRFVVIVPPLIQLFVFSYAATYEVRDVTLAVLDRSGTPESRELLTRLGAAKAFSELLVVDNDAALKRAVVERDARAAIHIGPDFARDLRATPPATVALILDGRASNSAQVINGYIATIVDDLNREWLAQAGAAPPPTVVVARAWFNPNLHSQWMIVPGLVGVLTMVVGLVVTSLSVARERELGTFDQLMVTPLRPWEILIGKTAPAMVIGLIEGSIIVAAAVAWFDVPLNGAVWLLYLGLTVFLLAIIGVGLFISALASTQQQAIVGAFLFLVPAIILSGFATPIENMPVWLQTGTLINPIRHFLTLVQGVFLKDIPLAVAFQSLWPMVVIAILTLIGATWFFRHRLR